MAVLSRAGCNQGTCHGNLHGKGGFKLSLRGEDPEKDHAALTRDTMGRRLNRLQPDESLLLLKPAGSVPHEGGQRFPRGSSEYEILYRWIKQGARIERPSEKGSDPLPGKNRVLPERLIVEPGEAVLTEPVQELRVKAWAVFPGGTRKDISGLAVFESTNPLIEVSRDGLFRSSMPGQTVIVVRYLHLQATSVLAFVPARPGFSWHAPPAANYIDELVFSRLKKLRMNPAALCTDSEYLRRAFIDLLGILPTPGETRKFLADPRAEKRSRLVETLLQRPEFAECWALRWSDLLRNEEKQLDRQGVKVYYEWIRRALADNKPLNQFARDSIAGRGSTYKEPAANYYRALRDPYIRAEATAQVFLGIRMQCARCHNHPFDRWTQNDYHQFAAFFPRVQYRIVANQRRDKLDKHEFVGEQVVYLDTTSEIKHPYTNAVMPPRFPGAVTPAQGQDRLLALADWVADPANPFFARTQANRIWSYLMGRGIVEPNDDFRLTNPPANGPLLDALAKDLAANGFDQKHLIRAIMNSRTYQLSAKPNETNADDEVNYARALVRSLPAEALFDAIAEVTGTRPTFSGYPEVTRAGQLPAIPGPGGKQKSAEAYRFLRTFGKPERLLSCDCERSDQATLAQALQLLTGTIVNDAVAQPDNRLGKLLRAGRSNADIIEELYLASLCRYPTDAERRALVERIERAASRREGLEDVLWGLVNCKEFLLRR